MRILMAPMEGVVDPYLRALYCEIGGIDLFVTEFIRVTHTLLPPKLFFRLCPELEQPLAVPVRVQLLGSDSHALAANASRAAALGAPSLGPRSVLTRPAVGLASRPAQAANCSGGGDAGARYGSFFFTNAQASVSSLRAAAQRATFIGLPPDRRRS